MKKPWTIAIDGPAGAGKSTVARLVARRLGYLYIDSGAMYRAVAYLTQREGISPSDDDAVAALARTTPIIFVASDADDGEQRVLILGDDVTQIIRTPEIASLASRVSVIPGVRTALVGQQQAMGACGGVVMEGRDIGTVVFPGAEVKIFLTASPEERSLRRHLDLQRRGVTTTTLEDVRADQDERDRRDETRAVSPLAPAPDALIIDSDRVPPDEIVAHILAEIDAKGFTV